MNTEITTLDTKLETLSNKYKVASTKAIAQKFKDLGFTVDKYQEAKVRRASKKGYQKHLVTLSNDTLLGGTKNGTKLQVLVTNSHDGTSSLVIQLGVYRFACANGLIVGETFEKINIRHTGDIVEKIEENVMRIVAQANRLNDVLEKMKSTQLDAEKTREFFDRAVKLRYENKTSSDVEIPVLREADEGNNVFNLFNRVQESLIRGGQKAKNKRGNLRTVKEVTSIDTLKRINEGLFDLAVEYSNAA
jgi:hypothetical protein